MLFVGVADKTGRFGLGGHLFGVQQRSIIGGRRVMFLRLFNQRRLPSILWKRLSPTVLNRHHSYFEHRSHRSLRTTGQMSTALGMSKAMEHLYSETFWSDQVRPIDNAFKLIDEQPSKTACHHRICLLARVVRLHQVCVVMSHFLSHKTSLNNHRPSGNCGFAPRAMNGTKSLAILS